MKQTSLLVIFSLLIFTSIMLAENCIDCHTKITPNIISDWQLSKHSSNGVDCEICHGSDHTSAADVDKVSLPNQETCSTCHDTQVGQFLKGKHAIAWASVNAMPTTHMLPSALSDGMKECGGCHK